MKIVMALGVPEAGTETMIDIALTRIKTNFFNLKISNTIKTKNVDIIEPYHAVKSITDKLTQRVEESVVDAIRQRKKDLIISGSVSIKTIYGYIPILNKRVFEMFKPEMIMFFVLNKNDVEEDTDSVIEHQRIDRNYAISLSLVANSFIRFVDVNKSNINTTIEEVVEILKEML